MKMRVSRYGKEIEKLLGERVFVKVEDFVSVCPGMGMPAIYSKVNKLLREGRLAAIGKGKYITSSRIPYTVRITPWMREINRYMVENCIGVNACIAAKEGNLFVQVAKSEMGEVMNVLQSRYMNVIHKENLKHIPVQLKGYIVLERLVSESPLMREEGMTVPSLEKQIVDAISDDGKAPSPITFQKAVEAYPVNLDSLVRYASRRGVKEEVVALVSALDISRVELMAKVQKYLSSIPVEKAWVFGSFARGEETTGSDLDLMVDYAKDVTLSLLDIVRFKLNLESLIGREVDLVQNGFLKPFAVPSAERDKYLIYERKD